MASKIHRHAPRVLVFNAHLSPEPRMTVSQRLRTGSFALFVAWTAVACAQAQRAPANATYEPEVGQPGKDVVWVPTPQAEGGRTLYIVKVEPKELVIDRGP